MKGSRKRLPFRETLCEGESHEAREDKNYNRQHLYNYSAGGVLVRLRPPTKTYSGNPTLASGVFTIPLVNKLRRVKGRRPSRRFSLYLTPLEITPELARPKGLRGGLFLTGLTVKRDRI